jgi:hypothetical protein
MIASPAIDTRTHDRLRYRHLPVTAAGSSLALESALMTLAFMGAVFGATYLVSPLWSLVALANYLWLCTLLFRWEPRGAVLVLPQLINNASGMVAMIMIEFGNEMFELGLVGRPGPWSNELNLCNLLFCAGVVAIAKPLMRALDRRGSDAIAPVLDRFANLLSTMTLVLGGLIALALVMRGLQAGFPLLAGTDRFQFRRFSADKVTLYALNLKFVIGYALGFVAFVLPCARWLRVGAGIGFAALMVIYFLFGDKFFTQLHALAAFTAPYLYFHYRKVGRHIWVYAIAGTLALASVMAVTTYIYSKGFTETSASTSKRLSGRIVGQGEIWFLQSSIGAPLLDWNAPLIDGYVQSLSIKSIDLFSAQNSLGPNYFSNRYAPDYLRSSLQRNAGTVTYTAVTEAMGLVLFGWLGLGAMMFAVGLLYGLVSAYVAYAIKNRSILSALFAAYIYNQFRTSVVQATPWVIGSIYSLRWLAIILAFELALLLLGRSSSGPRYRGDRPWLGRRLEQSAQPPV